MFKRYRMTPLRWLGFFAAVLITPGMVSLLIFSPVFVALGLAGHPDARIVAGGLGFFGIAAGLPFAVLGIILCPLLSKAFGYFSFPQAFVIGIGLAAAMARWLAKDDLPQMGMLMLAAVFVIVVTWQGMRLLRILPVSQAPGYPS